MSMTAHQRNKVPQSSHFQPGTMYIKSFRALSVSAKISSQSLTIAEIYADQQAPVVKIFFPCLDPAALRQKSTSLYQNAQDGAISDRLLVYGCLSSFCGEISGTTKGAESEHNDFLARSFRQHLVKTINVMPAVQNASWDGVEALMIAVSYSCGLLNIRRLTQHPPGVCMSGDVQAATGIDAYFHGREVLPNAWL